VLFQKNSCALFFPSLLTECLMNSPDLLVPETALEAVCRLRSGIQRAVAMVWRCHSAQAGGEAIKQTQLCPPTSCLGCLPLPCVWHREVSPGRGVLGQCCLHQDMGFCGSERHPLGKSFSHLCHCISPRPCTHSALSNHLFCATCLGRRIGRMQKEKLIGIDAF